MRGQLTCHASRYIGISWIDAYANQPYDEVLNELMKRMRMHDQEVLFLRRVEMTNLHPGEPTQEILCKILQVRIALGFVHRHSNIMQQAIHLTA